MVVACIPCIAPSLIPTALGALGLVGVSKLSKRKKKGKSKNKGKSKGKNKGKKSKLSKNKSMKGGSGYETQEEYEQMMNDNLSRESSYDRKERENN